MGKLVYGSQAAELEFDDRALFHVQIVIANKLRRGESFMLSWKNDPSLGEGRSTVWIDRAIPLHFKFHGSKVPTVNPAWLERLTESANSPAGLVMMAEPTPS